VSTGDATIAAQASPAPARPTGPAQGTPADRLASGIDAAFDALSAYAVVRRVARPIAGSRSWAAQSIAFTLLLLGVCMAGAVWTGEPATFLALQLWSAVLLLAVLLAFHGLARAIVDTLRDKVFPVLPPAELDDAAARLRTALPLRLEPIVSWGVGVLTILLAGVGLYLLLGTAGPFAYLNILVGSALTVSMVFVPATVTAALLHLTSGPIRLPPVRPEISPLVVGWRSITRHVIRVAALVATIGVIGPFLVPGLGSAATVVASLVLAGATSAVLVLIIVQHRRLGTLLRDHRRAIEKELLTEIGEYYERRHALDAADIARVEALVLFQKLVAERSGRERMGTAVAILRQLAPMSLPLLGLLAGSVDIPFIENDTLVFLILEWLLDTLR
jgi:hypothetical protein